MKRYLILILLSIITNYTRGQFKYELKGEVGILEWTGQLDKNVSILNEDGSVWMNFNINKESELIRGEWTEEKQAETEIKHQINPLVFTLENLRLHFRVLEIKSDHYKVEITDEVFKYIKINENWIFRKWGQYISETVAVIGFESEMTAIYSEPNENSKLLNETESINPQIFPIDSESDWLQIKYTCGKAEYKGWIKWRDENQMLIELFYDM